MQLTPRYDGPAILRVDLHVDDPSVPLVRQRRRLARVLERLDEDQWASASRCDGWSVQDVVTHLVTTNQFWTISIMSGLAGRPTRFLSSFDPVRTPAEMVDGMRTMTPSDVLGRYLATTDDLAGAVTDLDETSWSTMAEGPPGYICVRAAALHALWDAWIHERDIVLPLGLDTVVEDDEVAGSLLYAAALGPVFLAAAGSTRRGRLAVVVTDPDLSFVVEHGSTVVVSPHSSVDAAPCLSGDAVSVLEGLSFRGPLGHGLSAEDLWLLGTLGDVFDVTTDLPPTVPST